MIFFLPHAEEAMQRRNIAHEWVEETLVSPDWTDTDPRFPDRRRSFKAIEAMGGRILRVVYWLENSNVIVLTVYPDRGALKQVKRS
jgi:hypothetical protein